MDAETEQGRSKRGGKLHSLNIFLYYRKGLMRNIQEVEQRGSEEELDTPKPVFVPVLCLDKSALKLNLNQNLPCRTPIFYKQHLLDGSCHADLAFHAPERDPWTIRAMALCSACLQQNESR